MLRQSKQQAELHKQLWAMANDLRGNMEGSEFKYYILGLIFYRYLSEKISHVIENVFLEEDDLSFSKAWQISEYKERLSEDILVELGYVIEPKYLYSNLVKQINTGIFDITVLSKAINNLIESTYGHESQSDFEGLFDDMDLNSTKLGRTEQDRSKLIGKIIIRINEIDLNHNKSEIDVLGDAYEYLIGQFAANAGKKAGEFYTPQPVSEILARIVTLGKKEIKNVYDPTCGSGSLLLRINKHAEVGKYYGQEKINTTYNLARMNMLLHKTPFNRFDIVQGDTLKNPHEDFLNMRFEAVVANPPYSQKWEPSEGLNQDDRFNGYGKIAPKSKADYAFIQHMIHQLNDNGTMAVVLPHGVLFRGAAEGVIRKHIISNRNYLDAVIGLPANLFFGTGIQTCILVFKKCREEDRNVMFIDASKHFEKVKTQNTLKEEHVNKIVDTYRDRVEIDKYSRPVLLNEIKDNDYNLNIPRYVDTFEEEEEIDLEAVANKILKTNEEMIEIDKQIKEFCDELGILSPIK